VHDRSRRFLLLGALALLSAPRAHAAIDGRALSLYRAGEFMEASDVARRAGGADNLALAARAVLALLVVDPRRPDFMTLAEGAQETAEQALAISARSVEARLQIAVALGLRGRRTPIAVALREGFASRAKQMLDEAVAAAPNDPWARALLGGWHLEVWRRGGAIGAAALGANIGQGISSFDRARAISPADPAIAVHYALALLGLGHPLLRDQVTGLLDTAVELRARDAFETHIRAIGARIRTALQSDGMDAARDVADAAFP